MRVSHLDGTMVHWQRLVQYYFIIYMEYHYSPPLMTYLGAFIHPTAYTLTAVTSLNGSSVNGSCPQECVGSDEFILCDCTNTTLNIIGVLIDSANYRHYSKEKHLGKTTACCKNRKTELCYWVQVWEQNCTSCGGTLCISLSIVEHWNRHYQHIQCTDIPQFD